MAERSQHAEAQARYVARHPEKAREATRKSVEKGRLDPEWREKTRERRQRWRNANRERHRAQQRAWKARNKHKSRASYLVRRAVVHGDIVKPDECSQCGDGGLIDAHHEDYSRPLDIVWLCRPCHGFRDAERRSRGA